MTAHDDAPPSTRRRSRRLSGEEQALWHTVARSVTPLRRRRPRADAAPPEPAESAAAEAAPSPAVPARTQPAPPPRPSKPPMPALETLGRRGRKRIATGRHAIDARIDLHGRTQAEAHSALLGFIGRCRRQGARTVLVITGKGGDRGGEGRGVLRRQVPLWLSLPELRDSVVGFEPATPAHGGEGALYVRLRRMDGG